MRITCGRLSLLLLSLFFTASVNAASGKAERKYYFGFGPGYFSNVNSRKMGADFAGGAMWSLSPQFELAGIAHLGVSMSETDVRYLSPQLKIKYMFSEEPFTWYAGSGLGFGYAHAHDGRSTKGFAISGAIGYRAYKGASMQLSFEFEHQMILKESAFGTPLFTSFKVGVHY